MKNKVYFYDYLSFYKDNYISNKELLYNYFYNSN